MAARSAEECLPRCEEEKKLMTRKVVSRIVEGAERGSEDNFEIQQRPSPTKVRWRKSFDASSEKSSVMLRRRDGTFVRLSRSDFTLNPKRHLSSFLCSIKLSLLCAQPHSEERATWRRKNPAHPIFVPSPSAATLHTSRAPFLQRFSSVKRRGNEIYHFALSLCRESYSERASFRCD
jgi:hypothetical protein